MKQSALALALLGGAALLVDPVVADTLYDMGDFAGRPKEHNHPPTFAILSRAGLLLTRWLLTLSMIWAILQADPKNITIPLLSGHSIKGRLTPTATAWSGVPTTTSLALA